MMAALIEELREVKEIVANWFGALDELEDDEIYCIPGCSCEDEEEED